MGCAAASLTPPNVSAASLEGDALRPVPVLAVAHGPGSGSALNPTSNSAAPPCRLDKDVKVGFVFERIKMVSKCLLLFLFLVDVSLFHHNGERLYF